jgi:LmbE family N-acetylglucosaminyl deacetylase
MNPYLRYVEALSTAHEAAAGLPLGGIEPLPRPSPKPDAPCVMIFAPHPDDECLVGGLPLRLMRRCGWRVINVPVTLGSNPARKPGRRQELANAVNFLGFQLRPLADLGLDAVNADARRRAPEAWARSVAAAAEALREARPALVVFPHERDWNTTHIGTSLLVTDALASLPRDFSCRVAQTEFWGQLYQPNLMVELTAAEVADLVAATSFHVEEVRRNPYHLRLPAQLMDNVRRGGEVVGRQGGAAPRFTYATLYLLKEWKDGALRDCLEGGRFVAATDDPARAVTL